MTKSNEKIERNKHIEELRKEGLTYREIGKRLEISYQIAFVVLNRETGRRNYKTYQKRLKQLALKHYGMKCAVCGMDDPRYLVIDHINGLSEEEKTNRKAHRGHNFYVRLKRENYPTGFQTLCFACNLEKQ